MEQSYSLSNDYGTSFQRNIGLMLKTSKWRLHFKITLISWKTWACIGEDNLYMQSELRNICKCKAICRPETVVEHNKKPSVE